MRMQFPLSFFRFVDSVESDVVILGDILVRFNVLFVIVLYGIVTV